MIKIENNIFYLSTKNSTYIFQVRDNRYLEHLYYGCYVDYVEDYSFLEAKFNNQIGNSVVTPDDNNLTLDDLKLEFNSNGVGDYRILPIQLENAKGLISLDFKYKTYVQYVGSYHGSTKLPKIDYDDCQTLEVELYDDFNRVTLKLIYTVYEQLDIITRRSIIVNNSSLKYRLNKLMSLNLDFNDTYNVLIHYSGTWIKERQETVKYLSQGVINIESTTGFSSNRQNPFTILTNDNCTEFNGNCFGFNLIYSGSFKSSYELSPFHKVRIVSGINNDCFSWNLDEGEEFVSPEATLAFSNKGLNGLSQIYHNFINNAILPKEFRFKERPVLINSWEANYFDFKKSSIIKLAKKAKKLGFELFVLDDGWFGKRNDDTTSLGDWQENMAKIGSLKILSNEINELGLKFGIWLEPEMVSINSELFKNHPDWAITYNQENLYFGRNQLLLDLTNKDVISYLKTVFDNLLKNNISYIKWDMNRHMSDLFSKSLSFNNEFMHRYILGLYELLNYLKTNYPGLIVESCASGGNRYDLGMLCFSSQVWISDNTDVHDRYTIQNGTYRGYPLSCSGCHVSSVINHQTLRASSLEDKFNLACFGSLGYELDLNQLNQLQCKQIDQQIRFYKKNRMLFQFGDYYQDVSNNLIWVVSKDKSRCIAMMYNNINETNSPNDILSIDGLNDEFVYKVKTRKQKISIKQLGDLVNQALPVKIQDGGIVQSTIDKYFDLDSEEEYYEVLGSYLRNCGIILNQKYCATGYNPGTRLMTDFSSRLYTIEKVDK